ncbi:MAG: hypothetical protein ACRDHY_10815, partial [Anaerolineales bacterium]
MTLADHWALQAGAILLPSGLQAPGFVVIRGDRIAEAGEGYHADPDQVFAEDLVAPGFVDLQINGAAGCDFLSPTADAIAAAHDYLLRA